MVALTTPQCLAGHGLSTFEVPVEQCGSTVRGLARGVGISSELGENSATEPILVLLHGYPQTNYMYYISSIPTHDPIFRWRHVVKLLPRNSRLFIPDLPGYGYSSPSQTTHDKGTIGRAILSSLSTLLSTSTSSQPIILIGHDRGARIIHRLAVDYNTTPYTTAANNTNTTTTFPILGAVLIDIVPTLTQWSGMSNPSEATGYFHWPFLANVDLATDLITQIGGDKFVRTCITRGLGKATKSISNFNADGAMEVYERPFRQMESVVRASCRDYEAGAGVDVELQRRDLERGEKMRVPVLVIYSRGIGRRFDVPGSWRDGGVVEREGLVSCLEMGEGVGHFVAEEDPEGTVEGVVRWMGDVLGV